MIDIGTLPGYERADQFLVQEVRARGVPTLFQTPVVVVTIAGMAGASTDEVRLYGQWLEQEVRARERGLEHPNPDDARPLLRAGLRPRLAAATLVMLLHEHRISARDEMRIECIRMAEAAGVDPNIFLDLYRAAATRLIEEVFQPVA